MKTVFADACVLGLGAGGYGAVCSLLRRGLTVVGAEKNPGFGGTAVYGGVNCWEPGVACGELHRRLADLLLKESLACAVSKTVPNGELCCPGCGEHDFSRWPWGLSVPDGTEDYDSTLRRCTSLVSSPEEWRRFQFEPEAMEKAMETLILPWKDRFTGLFGAEYVSCEHDKKTITAVTVRRGGDTVRIEAKLFYDGTGDILLCEDAGCEISRAPEAESVYHEPCAGGALNGATTVFRVTRHPDPDHIDPWQGDPDARPHAICCLNTYPNGDLNGNMLPTLSGGEALLSDGAEKAGKLVLGYWNRLQTDHGLRGWTLTRLFTMAKRESVRLVGRHVLTENEVRMGYPVQPLSGTVLTLSDHALDTHGKDSRCRELAAPYGIPADCTRAKEYDNLFAVCRGASFSHVAASSARLTRTMLAMGEGAGLLGANLLRYGEIRAQEVSKEMLGK